MKRAWIGLVLIVAASAIPAMPAWAKGTGAVFISSEKDNVITVLDGKSYQQSGVIEACQRPRHMQLTADRERLIVMCGDDGTVVVIDIAGRKVVDKIRLQEGVEMFDLSPDGKTLYSSNEDEAQVVVVDLASKKVQRKIKVAEEPEGVLVAPDGKTVYVASEVASMVHVIDAASGKVVKNIEVGKRPRRLVLTPDGKELWVTNEMGASVSIIRIADHMVAATIKFEPKGFRPDEVTPVGIMMTSDGKTAFVALGRANHVAVLDVAARAVKKFILVGKRAGGLALSHDNGTLYVANELSDDVTIIDAAAGRAIKSVRAGRVPHSVVIDD